MFSSTRPARLCCLALLLPLVACADPEDQAARARFYAATPPAEATAAEATPPNPQTLAEDRQAADRVLGMPFTDVARQLASLRFKGSTTFTFRGDGDQVRHTDTVLLEQDGQGNYRIRTGGDGAEEQRELVWKDARLYVRHRNGNFRLQDRTDPLEPAAVRQEVWGSLSEVVRMLSDRLELRRKGTQPVGGRSAVAYEIHFRPGAEPTGATTTSTTTPWREQRRVPLAAKGTVAIDSATGVVLQAKMEARFRVVDDPGTELTITVDHAVDRVGQPVTIEVPEHVPAYRRPRPLQEPLPFYKPKAEAAQ